MSNHVRYTGGTIHKSTLYYSKWYRYALKTRQHAPCCIYPAATRTNHLRVTPKTQHNDTNNDG